MNAIPGTVRNSFSILRVVASILVLLGYANCATAQSGPAPGYIAALAPYTVVRLDGNLAPANGKISMRDITPSEWLNNDPGNTGLRAVIIAWNGGAKGVGSKLFVHGGGHTDSANNGLYIFDFSGTDLPKGWTTPLEISPISAVRANSATYSDGFPTAVHTYDGLVYASHNQTIYRFGGSQYNSGFMTDTAFKWSEQTQEWSRLPNYPSNSGGAKTVYDPVSGNIFVTMNDSLEGRFFRTDTETWSSAVSYGGNGFPFNSMAAWDPSRSRGIVVGDGEKSVIDIDFSAETVDVTSFSPDGDTGIFGRSGVSAVYDSDIDVYWIFGGDTSSPGWSNLYQMNADGPPWNVKSISLSGASIERSSGMYGSWGRYVFMRGWRALGVIASETSPAYVIRLPGEPLVAPKPPTDLAAQ